MRSDIVRRLQATVGIDAINGDSFERSIVLSQIKEAVIELNRCYSEIDDHVGDIDCARNETYDECATLAETLKEDRHGKLPQFHVADAIREMKVEK